MIYQNIVDPDIHGISPEVLAVKMWNALKAKFKVTSQIYKDLAMKHLKLTKLAKGRDLPKYLHCYDQPYVVQEFSMRLKYILLLSLIFLYLYSSSVSISLLGYVFYLADLMSTMHSSHFYLMVHRYI